MKKATKETKLHKSNIYKNRFQSAEQTIITLIKFLKKYEIVQVAKNINQNGAC